MILKELNFLLAIVMLILIFTSKRLTNFFDFISSKYHRLKDLKLKKQS